MIFFDALFAALGVLLPLIVTVALMLVLMVFGPRLITAWRQRGYDEVSVTEAVRLRVVPPAGIVPDPELATELIRALHPRQPRGFDAWRVGWPLVELAVIGQGGELAWEVVTNRQIAVQLEQDVR